MDFKTKNLILNGMDFLVESKFLGIGAGAYREFNLQKKGKRDIGTVIEAHNFVVEILVQYGILIFALGLGIFGWILLKLFQSFFKKHWSLQHTLVLFLFFCIITTGNSNSTYIPLPTNWIILILFLIHSNELMKLESENAQF